MRKIEYKIDKYSIKLFAQDKKGKRKRWGDKVITLFSGGQEIGRAVFAAEGENVPEPYCADDMIYFFAPSTQYQAVKDLLEGDRPVYMIWESVSDPKEPQDGDAYFFTPL